jgi:hypothetical protein
VSAYLNLLITSREKAETCAWSMCARIYTSHLTIRRSSSRIDETGVHTDSAWLWSSCTDHAIFHLARSSRHYKHRWKPKIQFFKWPRKGCR